MRTAHVLAIPLLGSALLAAGSAHAQVSTPAGDPAAVRYEFGGYLRLEGVIVQNDPSVDFVGRNDGFRIANARLQVDGRWMDRLTFRISADGADDERESPNATTGQLRFALKDAYADVNLGKVTSLRLGKFYAIFDLDEAGGQSDLQFVDRSLESRGVFATEGWETPGLAPGRSQGVALRAPRAFGSEALSIGYELAAQNGSGENSSGNDNDELAYSGTAIVSSGDRLLAWIGGRHNRRSVGELPFREVEEDIAGVAAAQLRAGPLKLAAQAIVRQTTFPTTGGLDENAFGAHGQIAFGFRAAGLLWEPGYRYAVLEPSDLVVNDRVQEHTLGVNLELEELRARLLLNLTHVVEEAGRELENDRVELLLQVRL